MNAHVNAHRDIKKESHVGEKCARISSHDQLSKLVVIIVIIVLTGHCGGIKHHLILQNLHQTQSTVFILVRVDH